ncbi:hypothetical protein AJ78_02226 [Emergomyces pasteurianus Ep9510]|uniref:YDG domain-containing protein n=1 Tax=Emergomyces pasteurianus Ep9510 TaxID=1447872 RepID=A0A1J9QR09_9EURO|nr:hypothetical protein AJ78_02226 [Emergomyces pasteurianus Ep9510]
MEPSSVRPESSERLGTSLSTPFSAKFEARFNELKREQSSTTASGVKEEEVRSATGTIPVIARTVAGTTGNASNLLLDETVSAAALEETGRRADRPMTIQQTTPSPAPKRKRLAVDPIQCTCAVSEECQRAARDGLSDCRIVPGVPIPKPKQSHKRPRPARENAPFRYLSTKEKARLQRSADDVLPVLTLFKKASTAPESEHTTIFKKMRERVQQLQFYYISEALPSLLQKFMDQSTGLPAIVNSPDDAVPWDIRLDCEAILIRWERGDFDPSLLRGIKVGAAAGTSRRLDKTYRFRKDSIVVGDNELRNGQWFPLQITAIRDGAHGEIEAGISGRDKIGAVSIILSSAGKGYPDIDQGDTISYCGTRGKDGQISAGTNLLIESHANRNPIRVLRSSKLPKINPYRPSAGFRYDGLYEIHGMEVLDTQTMLHRFKLRRIPGQTPIRYQGVEKRPTEKEIEEWKKIQNLTASSKLN